MHLIIHKKIKKFKICDSIYYTLTSPQRSLILLGYVLTPQGRSTIFKSEDIYILKHKNLY